MKISSHWTKRAIRLWFNNNKARYLGTHTDKPGPVIYPDLLYINRQRPQIQDPEPQISMQDISQKLDALEAATHGLPQGSPKYQEIATDFDKICSLTRRTIKMPHEPLTRAIHTMEFPPPPPPEAPLDVAALLNPKKSTIPRSVSHSQGLNLLADEPEELAYEVDDFHNLWQIRNFIERPLPPFEASLMCDGLVAYITPAGIGRRSLYYAKYDCGDGAWTPLNFDLQTSAVCAVHTLSGDGANIVWVLSHDSVVRIPIGSDRDVAPNNGSFVSDLLTKPPKTISNFKTVSNLKTASSYNSASNFNSVSNFNNVSNFNDVPNYNSTSNRKDTSNFKNSSNVSRTVLPKISSLDEKIPQKIDQFIEIDPDFRNSTANEEEKPILSVKLPAVEFQRGGQIAVLGQRAFCSSQSFPRFFSVGSDGRTAVTNLPSNTIGVNTLIEASGGLIYGMARSTVLKMVTPLGQEVRSFIGHTDQPLRLHKVSRHVMASSGLDGCVKLWDIRDSTAFATLTAGKNICITMSSCESHVMCGFEDQRIRVIDVRRQTAVAYMGVDVRPWLPLQLHYVTSTGQLAMLAARRSQVERDNFNPDTTLNPNFFRVYGNFLGHGLGVPLPD